MNLTVKVFGIEVLSVNTESPSPDSERGESTSVPAAFVGFTTDARWQPGAQP